MRSWVRPASRSPVHYRSKKPTKHASWQTVPSIPWTVTGRSRARSASGWRDAEDATCHEVVAPRTILDIGSGRPGHKDREESRGPARALEGNSGRPRGSTAMLVDTANSPA